MLINQVHGTNEKNEVKSRKINVVENVDHLVLLDNLADIPSTSKVVVHRNVYFEVRVFVYELEV